MKTLDNLSTKDIFSCSAQEKQLIIEQGVELLMVEAEIFHLRTGESFSTGINLILQNTQRQIKFEDENENYELSYYLNELTWAVLKKIEEINELKQNNQLVKNGIEKPNHYL